ncbi:MAG: hypothetical protein WCJ30_18350, partial [Deltaproteobacteria bacterium]
TFRFTALLGVQSEQRKPAVTADEVKSLRILVVDDNASARVSRRDRGCTRAGTSRPEAFRRVLRG